MIFLIWHVHKLLIPWFSNLIDLFFWFFLRFFSDYRFDVSKLEPVVAKVCNVVYWKSLSWICWFSYKKSDNLHELQPHSPDNRALARECKDVKIDRVYIGSCTGGKTEDFLAAAKVFLASVRILNPTMVCMHVG